MKLLLIDPFSDSLLHALTAQGHQLNYLPDAEREEVEARIHLYDGLILNSKLRVDKILIDKAIRLRFVIRAGVGLDHFDVPYLEEKGIKALNTAGANADSVGEHTVGMLLALRHKLMQANAEVKRFEWRREANRGLEIKGKTVGIVGYGHTGTAVAKKLRGFECRILAYDKYKSGFGTDGVEEVGMQRIFEEADILSLHIPLTDETRAMIDGDYLAGFRKNITFLNLSRGEIVRTSELLKALETGKVNAAALDVLEQEKFDKLTESQRTIYQQLFDCPNVILSPHVGGWSVESKANIERAIVELVNSQAR